MNGAAAGGPVPVAALQMRSGEDRERNLRDARALVREAAAAGARLAVLPENFALMSADERRRLRIAEPDGHGPIQDALADMAAASGVWLVGGSLPIAAAPDRPPASACCVYDPDGRRRARYDKIHLFDVDVPGSGERYRESATTTPGELPVALDTPWGRLGLAVCYDLRFPELFRQLSEQGAEIFAVPAAFTRATGRAHWDVLLRARAIENLAHVIAAAQAGTHPGGRQTWGHTAIVEPWGEIVAQRASAPGVVLAELDPQRTRRLREAFPALQHRRLGGKDRDDGRN